MLQHKACCVCEIKEPLGIAQPIVSKHFRVLGTAGLVSAQKQGACGLNTIFPTGGAVPMEATLMGNLRRRLNEDSEVTKTMERMRTIDAVQITKRQDEHLSLRIMRKARLFIL